MAYKRIVATMPSIDAQTTYVAVTDPASVERRLAAQKRERSRRAPSTGLIRASAPTQRRAVRRGGQTGLLPELGGDRP